MSLILLYFLHSTSVLSFYIDVVLTLSIEDRNNLSAAHCAKNPYVQSKVRYVTFNAVRVEIGL